MAPKKKNEEDPGWRKCEAKKLLAKDIIDGVIDDDLPWQEVFWWRPEYAATAYSKFSGRLSRLRGQFFSAKQRALSDDKALKHDRKLFPVKTSDERGVDRWEGSGAQSWLRQDVSDGLHQTMKPRKLYDTRPSYQQFSIDVFREHIYQEQRFQKFCQWRKDKEKPHANEWV